MFVVTSKTHGVRLIFYATTTPTEATYVSGLFAAYVAVRIKRVEFSCLYICTPTGRDTEVRHLFLEYEEPRR